MLTYATKVLYFSTVLLHVCHGQGYCLGSSGMAGGGVDFSVIPPKELRNPDFCASGYLILFCLLKLLKYMILHPKSYHVCLYITGVSHEGQ